jgi:polyhydroxybutyrate depolymerase
MGPTALALLALLTACTTSAEQTSAPPSHAVSASPSASASASGEFASVDEQSLPISIDGDERRIRVFLPELPAGEVAPLFILLHGNNDSTSVIADDADADRLAAREGVIVALPPAREGYWDARIYPDEQITPSPDVAYVSGLITILPDQLPVDRERVYVGGFSMGAVLADRLACESADLIRAAVVTSGAPWSDECAPSRPVSVLIMHGTADSIFSVEDARALAGRWRAIDGCEGDPEQKAVDETATAYRSRSCAGGTQVEFVEIDGQPHRWFSEPSATALAWQFITGLE